MNGYTFSSSFDPPDKPWIKMAIAIVLIMVLLSAGLEMLLRQRGFKPSIQDKPSLWATYRSSVQGVGPEEVVLVGSSRFHLGIHAQRLAEALPGTPNVHQLAISAGAILPVLEDLAADPTFRGTILLEFHPVRLGAKKPAAERMARDYLMSWRKGSYYEPVEAKMRAFLQHNLAIFGEKINFKAMGRALAKTRKLPEPPIRLQQPGRHILYNANASNLTHLDKKWAAEVGQQTKYDEAALKDRIDRMARAAKAIRARGGEVIVFRINASGHFLKAEKQHMPRARYYERAKAAVGGTWVHFEDDPVLRTITCPDGSHVMGDDVKVLTKALVKYFPNPSK